MRTSWFDRLEPDEALAEVVAGLVMVLTFTLAAGLFTRSGEGGHKTLVIAAVGCNVAWGLIDAALYLLGRKTMRSSRALFANVQLARDADAAQDAIRQEWEPMLLEATCSRIANACTAPCESSPSTQSRFLRNEARRHQGRDCNFRPSLCNHDPGHPPVPVSAERLAGPARLKSAFGRASLLGR